MKEFIKSKIIGTEYEWESHLDNINRLIYSNLREYKATNLLDVGCGSGDRTIHIANHFNIDYTQAHGVDFNEQQVEACKKIFNARIIDLESQNLPYDDNTFDLVNCNQVLEHIRNSETIINEISRVTKVGGYIILGIPNLAHLINRLYLLFGIQPLCIRIGSSHIRGFTHKSFLKMLKMLEGVELMDYKGSLMYPLPFVIAKFLSKYIVGMSGFTCYLLRKVK